MRMTRRRLVLITMVLALALVGIFVVTPVVRIFVFMERMAQRAERGREHLFLATDYHELLSACRGLLRQMPPGEWDSRSYHVHLGTPDPEASALPQVILDLEPALVDIRPGDGTVLIQLFPGPEWFGVMASAEYRDGYCAVKLIDGLWYSDAEYGSEHPEYVEKINTMIEEGRRRKEVRQSVPPPQP
jgi:hypothetical protein